MPFVRVAVLLGLVAVTACSGQGGGSTPSAGAAPANPATASRTVKGADGTEGTIVGTPAPGSKFARVQIGMGKREVEDTIGAPTDEENHITGKSFIPFYFGGDTSRIEAHYKGEGVLTYSPRSFASSSYELIGITVDPTERGYAN